MAIYIQTRVESRFRFCITSSSMEYDHDDCLSDYDIDDIEYGDDVAEERTREEVCAEVYTAPDTSAMVESVEVPAVVEECSDSDDDTTPCTDLFARRMIGRITAEEKKKEEWLAAQRAADEKVEADMQERLAHVVGTEQFREADPDKIRKIIAESALGLLPSLPAISPEYMVTSKRLYTESIGTHVIREIEVIGKRSNIRFVHCATFDLAVKHAEYSVSSSRIDNPICMHEQVLGNYPFKAVLDVDIKKGSAEFDMAVRKATHEHVDVHKVILNVLVNEFVQVSFAMGGVRKNVLPYVVWANRKDKLSFHIIAHDEGMICRDRVHMVEFIDRLKANLISSSVPSRSEAAKYVRTMLGGSDTYIDTGLVKKKMFSLRLPLFDKIAESNGDIKEGSMLKPYAPEYTPASYSSYFLQRLDVVWHATKISTQQPGTMPVSDEMLSKLVTDVVTQFPEFVLCKVEPMESIIATFKRVAKTRCRCPPHNGGNPGRCPECPEDIEKCKLQPHKPDKSIDGLHESKGAFITRSNHRGFDKYTLFCGGCEKPKKIYEVIDGVRDTSLTSVCKYMKSSIVGNTKYLYGSGGMIPDIDEDITTLGLDYYVMSAYGTGKTRYISAIVEMVRATGYILIISPRKSLSAKYVKDIGARSYESLTGAERFDPVNDHVCVVQFDSLHRVPPGMRFDFVVIDEPAALINHIQSNTIRIGSFDMSKPLVSVTNMTNQIRLQEILRPNQSSSIVVLDNDLSDDIIDAFAAVRVLANGTPIEKKIYVNGYKPYTKVKSTIDSETGAEIRMKEHLFEVFLKKNMPLCVEGKHRGAGVSCHTAKSAKKLYDDVCTHVRNSIGEEYVSRVALYTGNSDSTMKREHFSDVNAHWESMLVVIFTQTVSVGVSFDGPHFTHMYADFRDMWHGITAVQSVQSLFRFRSVKQMYLAIAKPTRENITYGKIITNKHQLAKEVELLHRMTHIGVYGDCYIATPAHLHGQIQATPRLSETNDEAVAAMMELMDKNFLNRIWVYDALVHGITMSNPVAYVDYLLRKVGIEPVYVKKESLADTVEGIEEVLKYYQEAVKAARDEMKQARVDEIEHCKAVISTLLEGDEEESKPLIERYPNLAVCMSLVKEPEPEPKKKPKKQTEEEYELAYNEASGRSEKVRNYTEGERPIIRVYYAWKNIGHVHINDITLKDVCDADSIYMINQARDYISKAKSHRFSDVAKDPRLITLSHCRSILTGIWGYNDEAIRQMCNVRVSAEELLGETHRATIHGLACVANKLTGKRVIRGKIEEIDLTNPRMAIAILNAYLQWCGASATRIKIGKAQKPYYEIEWKYAPPEEMEESAPGIEAETVRYTIVEWGM